MKQKYKKINFNTISKDSIEIIMLFLLNCEDIYCFSKVSYNTYMTLIYSESEEMHLKISKYFLYKDTCKNIYAKNCIIQKNTWKKINLINCEISKNHINQWNNLFNIAICKNNKSVFDYIYFKGNINPSFCKNKFIDEACFFGNEHAISCFIKDKRIKKEAYSIFAFKNAVSNQHHNIALKILYDQIICKITTYINSFINNCQ